MLPQEIKGKNIQVITTIPEPKCNYLLLWGPKPLCPSNSATNFDQKRNKRADIRIEHPQKIESFWPSIIISRNES